jgi:hypothetical protein
MQSLLSVVALRDPMSAALSLSFDLIGKRIDIIRCRIRWVEYVEWPRDSFTAIPIDFQKGHGCLGVSKVSSRFLLVRL